MKQKKQQNKKQLAIIAGVIVVLVLAGISSLVLTPKKVTQVSQSVPMSPTPTLPASTVTDLNTNTKKVTFPEYRVSFQLPSKFFSEADPVNHPYIYLSSPDSKTLLNGTLVSGVSGSVIIYKGWDGFSNERPENKQVWSKFVIDNSSLPINNPLVTPQTARVYKSGGPYAEVKIDTRSSIGDYSRFSVGCLDLSANRCPEIVNTILSTLQINK